MTDAVWDGNCVGLVQVGRGCRAVRSLGKISQIPGRVGQGGFKLCRCGMGVHKKLTHARL